MSQYRKNFRRKTKTLRRKTMTRRNPKHKKSMKKRVRHTGGMMEDEDQLFSRYDFADIKTMDQPANPEYPNRNYWKYELADGIGISTIYHTNQDASVELLRAFCRASNPTPVIITKLDEDSAKTNWEIVKSGRPTFDGSNWYYPPNFQF